MKTGILKVFRWFLLIWGCVSLIAVMAIVVFVAVRFGPGNRDKDDLATARDVRFVLNWCELGDERIETVVHSHVSARALGDHLDAYAIKISRVDVAELTSKTDGFKQDWYRGDQLPKVLDDAISLVEPCRAQIPWFPAESELRTSEVYVRSWSVGYHGVEPNEAKVIFVHPADKMVFYFEIDT